MGTLLVASTGGHLAQLHRLAPRIPQVAAGQRTWVTFDTPQSRSLLAGEDVEFMAFTSPRDWRNVARNTVTAQRLLRTGRFDQVISTGSGVALSFLPMARLLGIRTTYIESAARSAGPSVTGRVLQRIPGIELATQYERWAGRGWSYAGSVFDEYVADHEPRNGAVARIVVSVGTIPYQFRRLVERVRGITPPGVEVVWQTGVTKVDDLGLMAHGEMPGDELAREFRDADAIVAHAGTGSAIAALEAGRCPVLVPRESACGEHVDDHQHQIADELERRGLAIARRVDLLEWDAIVTAAGRRIRTLEQPPGIRLRQPG